MRSITICSIALFLSIIFNLPARAEESDVSDKNWGIGVQGNYPLLGGISVRYYGLSPVYLQAVGRFIMNGDERDNMFGGGLSYAVFEYAGYGMTRLYFSLEGGERYEKDRRYFWNEKTQRDEWRMYTKKTYGFGVVFGTEFAFPFLGTQIGFNAEIGQGYGRIDEDSKTKDIASFIVGGGMHVYF